MIRVTAARQPGAAPQKTHMEPMFMAHINKEPICRDRIRRINGGFGWVDHRLVRDHYVDDCSPVSLALYLFLIAVSDADGVSYWGEKAIAGRLRIGMVELRAARAELEATVLIAYAKPVWQVLQLPARREVRQ